MAYAHVENGHQVHSVVHEAIHDRIVEVLFLDEEVQHLDENVNDRPNEEECKLADHRLLRLVEIAKLIHFLQSSM